MLNQQQGATMMDITAVLAGSFTVLCLVLIYVALISEWQR